MTRIWWYLSHNEMYSFQLICCVVLQMSSLGDTDAAISHPLLLQDCPLWGCQMATLDISYFIVSLNQSMQNQNVREFKFCSKEEEDCARNGKMSMIASTCTNWTLLSSVAGEHEKEGEEHLIRGGIWTAVLEACGKHTHHPSLIQGVSISLGSNWNCYKNHQHTLWGDRSVVMFCTAFCIYSTGCWADTAAIVQPNW